MNTASAALADPDQTTFVQDVVSQAAMVLSDIGHEIPHFVFARCLIGVGDESLEYLPTPLIWNPALQRKRKVEVAAGLRAYLTYGREFRRLGVGHAVVRTVLKHAPAACRLARVLRAPLASAIHREEELITSLQPYSEFLSLASPIQKGFYALRDLHLHELSTWSETMLANVDVAGAVGGLADLPDVQVASYPNAQSQDHNSYALVKVWFDASGLAEQWIFPTPHVSDQCKWGGTYFIFEGDLTDTAEDTHYALAMVSQAVFLQAHWRHIARLEAQKEARLRVRVLLDDLLHSLENALTTGIPADADGGLVQQAIAVELYKVRAVSVLSDKPVERVVWDVGALEGEGVAETIRGRFSFHNFNARIDSDCLIGKRVHPCFPALVIELVHNASKRRWVHPAVVIAVDRSSVCPRLYRLECRTRVRQEDVRALTQRLSSITATGCVRGIAWIVQLFEHLRAVGSSSRLSWTFDRSGSGNSAATLEIVGDSSLWIVRAALGAASQPTPGLFNMLFVADELDLEGGPGGLA
ncbi:MAG: hypothetical protein U1D55_07340 [Phycisphaerae bacterium]